MKPPLATSFAAFYAQCVNTYWSMITGRVPAPVPIKELTPKAAQAAANQEWEAEGGTCKPAKPKDR